ncbi:MAG: transporter substrate-binding domain-containing protein [Termitinemataceae bacterium]|nr:MAG: transporter substrate-binding domain-containing protein [Termitinemataceae bacterium]
MKKIAFVFAILIAALLFTGCKAKKDAAAVNVKKVIAASTQAYRPYDFVNDAGEADGFEVAVLKEVAALIDGYEFEYVSTSDDDLLIGIESGRYAVGTKGIWSTEERKKKYLIPEENIAVSVIGIVYRKNTTQIKDFDSFAKYSGKLVPIPPQSAQFSLIEDYNKEHADTPITLIPSDVFIISDAYTWIIEERADAFLDIKLTFEKTVLAEDGPWHSYADRLSYAPWKSIPTYPLFNKDQKDLAEKYDAAIKVLRANGTLEKLSEKYFGEDVFKY